MKFKLDQKETTESLSQRFACDFLVQLDFQMKFYLLIASLLLLVYKFKAANVPNGSPNAAQERNDKDGIPMTRTIRGTNPKKNGNDKGTGKKNSGGKSKGKKNQEK